MVTLCYIVEALIFDDDSGAVSVLSKSFPGGSRDFQSCSLVESLRSGDQDLDSEFKGGFLGETSHGFLQS